MRAADPVPVDVFSARAVGSSSRLTGSLPPTRDATRTNSPGCRTSRLRRHAASAGPPAECDRSWYTGSVALSIRHSSLLHASSHGHSHSWDRPQPLRLPGLSAPNQPLVGPETPSRRHTLQWPLLLMPGGNSRLRRREARWQDYNLAATVPHVVARCHRVHPAGSGGTCARPGVFNAPRSAPEPGRGSLAVWGVTRRNYWATPSHDSGLVDGRRETVRHDRSGAGPAPATESVGPNRLICCRAVGLRTASSSYG
jgi:hypothetical protein